MENLLLSCFYFIDTFFFNPEKISSYLYFFIVIVKMNQDQPNYEQSLFIQNLPYSKGVIQHRLLALWQSANVWEHFIMEKRESFKEAYWRLSAPESWKAGSRLTRSGAFYVVGEGCIFPFLLLVLSWKQGQTLGKLSVINEVLAVWGPLLWGS